MQIVRPGNYGQISIHNRSTGTVDVTVDLQGWFQATRVVPVDQEQSFISDAVANGADSEVAQQAVYDDSLASTLPTSTTTEVEMPDGSVDTSVQDGTDTPAIADAEDLDDPVDSSGAADIDGTVVPDGTTSAYPPVDPDGSSGTGDRWISIWERNRLGNMLFKAEFHTVWTYRNRVVTGILAVSIVPHTYFPGWTYRGSGSREDYYYIFGVSHGGHHSLRTAKFGLCAGSWGCFSSAYETAVMNVHGDGTHNFYNKK